MSQELQIWWSKRAAREKNMLIAAAVLVAAALVWRVGVSPALKTLRNAAEQQGVLQTQLQALAQMQAEARKLQSQPVATQAEAMAALNASVQQSFGNAADITVRASDASVTLRAVSADALAQWLAATRANAHATVLQARLTRTGERWSGSLQLGLPAQ